MLALAFVLDGRSRMEAAENGGMDRQTLRDRVHRCTTEGVQGLVGRPLPGRTPMADAAQRRALATIVEAGPDPRTDGVVRSRRLDLCGVAERRSGPRLAERTMRAIRRRRGFARLWARPKPAIPARPGSPWPRTIASKKVIVPTKATTGRVSR
jgi:transposase